MDRNDFYFKQRVTQAEMDETFDRAELAQRDQVKDILGHGFLLAAAVPATVEEFGTPDLTVLANAFLGYDQLGRKVSNVRSGYQGATNQGTPPQRLNLAVDEVSASTAVTVLGQEKKLAIFVEFRRHNSDGRTDGNGNPVDWRKDESIQFNVVQSAQAALGTAVLPPKRSTQLLLADVTLIFGQTAILDADISQARRDDFVLTLPHGGSHVEGGADPIPNATTSTGGLESAADKTKLDGITFTKAGIGALFDCQSKRFQPANVTAPATTTLDVTAAMSGKSAGGGAAKEAVVTQSGAPYNRVVITDDDHDDLLDSAGNKVYGRITVNNETTPTAWTLTFYTFDETSGEAVFDMTPHAGKTLLWFVVETYRLHNLPTFGSDVAMPSDQVAAEVAPATTTLAGKILLALQAGDKAGNLSKVKQAGADVASGIHTFNFSAGVTNPAPGVVDIATGTGPPGPPGVGSPGPPGVGSPGPPGPGFSNLSTLSSQSNSLSPSRSGSSGFSFGFTVKMFMCCLDITSPGPNYDAAWITGASASGSGVTVNWQTDDAGSSAGQNFTVGCAAAG